MEKLRRQTMARRSTAEATELLARAVEITTPSTLATTTGSLEIRLRSPASHVTLLGRTRWNRRVASLRRRPSRLRGPAQVLKVISQLVHT
jgi:hypothetical protein